MIPALLYMLITEVLQCHISSRFDIENMKWALIRKLQKLVEFSDI